MKYINIFFYSMSVIFFQVHSAADSASNEKWLACIKAIKEDNVSAFEGSFSKDLLPMYNIMLYKGKMIPAALVHIAAISKAPNAARIMETILSGGQDPNEIKSCRGPYIIVTEVDERMIMQGVSGLITGLTPLDMAVAGGNVPVVKALLQRGADPYTTALLSQTSVLATCIKMLLCKRVGEDPLVHARAYLENIKAASQESHSIEGVHGAQKEYSEIITLLEQAQMRSDLEDIGRCPCVIS